MNIVVPELGESVVEARVARWLKKPGDRVEIGEPVVELETEKIDLEVNAEKPGVITSIARKEGDDVKIGEVLGVLDESGAAVTPTPPSGNGSKTAAAPAPTPEPAVSPKPEAKADPPAPTREATLAPTSDSTTAPTREARPAPTRDSAIAPTSVRPLAPTSERSEQRVRMSKRRQTIARRLVE